MRKLLTILFLFSILFSSAQIQQHGTYYASLAGGTGDFPCSGVIAGYKFNETSGTTATDVTGNNDGTNTDVTLQQSTVTNLTYSYGFNGTTSNVSGFVSLNGLAKFSISVWAKADVYATGLHPLVAKWLTSNTSVLTRINAGDVQFYTKNSSGTQVGGTFLTLSDTDWHHYVFVYNGSTMRVYFDGSLDATSFSQTGSIIDEGTSTSYVGAQGDGTNFFDGNIDQPFIWDEALTSTEITALYNSGDGYANDCAVAPTVTTTSITSIKPLSATGGGNITSNGGASITAKGVCWSTSTSPTTADSKTTDGTGTGTFISALTLTTCGQLYYVRAYATNSVGTSYGSQTSFTTTSVNLSQIVLAHSVTSSDCADVTITSEATAEAAIDLYVNGSCADIGSSGYIYRAESLTLNEQSYSATACTAPSGGNVNRWAVFLTSPPYKVVFINSAGVFTDVATYIP